MSKESFGAFLKQDQERADIAEIVADLGGDLAPYPSSLDDASSIAIATSHPEGVTFMTDESKKAELKLVSEFQQSVPETEPHKGNSGTPTNVDPTVPITVGDPDDAASMAIDQRHMEDFTNADMQPGVTECRRPPKGQFFTVLPEEEGNWRNRAYYFLLEVEGRDPYLVTAEVAEAKKEGEDTIRLILLVRYVLMNGTEGLWALKLNPPDGKSNRWNTSAMNVLRIAEGGKWVRLISKGEYRYSVSKKTLQEVPPKFSDRSYGDLVNDAFPVDRRIKTLDHPIWDELANGSLK
jgi:hypothetical protein